MASLLQYSCHNHRAWLLPQASPVASTHAPLRAPMSSRVPPYQTPVGLPASNTTLPAPITNHASSFRCLCPFGVRRIAAVLMRHVFSLAKNMDMRRGWERLECVPFEFITNQQQLLAAITFHSNCSNECFFKGVKS